ncbi:relaxin receptor 1-like [Oratosquilla oratoria]|uniref:relaxin receptor 1-like n=1 Tax=Oratosquilla oratoria TaxID=337810 RepID=UPI003F771465
MEDCTNVFLEYNEIEVLERDSLAGFGKLTSLFLGDNGIRYIDRRAFVHTPLLLTLSLNNNRLQTLDFLTPGALSSLQDLNVDANPLLVLSLGSVTSLKNLKSLKLQYIEFTSEQLLNISSLDIKVVVHFVIPFFRYFKRFRYCSFLSRIRNCHPKTDGVSSFENLLVQAGLRKAVWVVAFLTITGNLTVIFGRVFSRDENKVLSVFIRNLAVADLLTGIYLLVVGITDKSLEMNYNKYAYEWMTSTKCTATGVLAMTSSQVSIFLLTFMSVERWVCITWPLQRRNLSMKETRWILLIIWILGFSIALAPVFIYQSPQGFYGTNGLCFPLHLDDPWVPGWFYSAIIFAVVNQIGVIVILLAYVSMFSNIRLTRAATPLSLGDREFALRFFFIVFTDCVCWTPIIVLRILALAEVDIDPQFYAYVVVVLLPINSALNPFLYTFTTSKFRSQVGRLLARSRMCRWTRRRDSDSEGTRTSFFRSGTYKWSSNGRSEAPLALHTHHDDTTVSEVVKVPSSSVVNCSKNEVTDVTLKEVALKDVALRIDNGTQQENQHKHNQQQEQLESQF